MKKGILQKLKEGPVLGDGGYLLELEKRGWVRAGPFTPEVALTNPEALRQLHIEFREAGAEVLQALTFYASRDKLATVGLQDRLEDLNRAAVRIAKEVAGERCLVAGNLSLTWMYEPGSNAKDRVRATFDEQLAVQVAEGVDFIIGETFSWLGEALIAVESAKRTGLPVMVTLCFENQNTTAEEKSAAEAAKALVDAGADIVGMNCLRPPEHMLGSLEEMRKAVPHAFLAAQPVAYRTPVDKPDFTSLPQFPFELDPLQLSRKEMAAYAQRARDIGVDYIGACCGAVATHIREMARVLGKLPAEQRPWTLNYEKPMSAYEYYDHDPAEVSAANIARKTAKQK